MANRFNLSDRIIERIGRRGLVLLLFSTVYLLFGIKSLANPSTDDGRFMLYTDLPAEIRGLMWIGAAALGIFAATLRRNQSDAIGFAALCVPTAILATSYLVSFLGFLFGVTDYPLGWVDALEWGTILAILQITSGWAEVDHEVIYVNLVDKKDQT